MNKLLPCLVALSLAALLAPGELARAQRPEPDDRIAQAAVAHILHELTSAQRLPARADIVVSPDLLSCEFTTIARGPILAERLARPHAGRVAAIEDVLTCDENAPRRNSCRLAADVVLQVGRPAIEGERATILVMLWATADSYLFQQGKEVSLEKRDGRWVVTGSKVILQS